jgi:tRNA A37 N6-isopentenylltransferase MiaA
MKLDKWSFLLIGVALTLVFGVIYRNELREGQRIKRALDITEAANDSIQSLLEQANHKIDSLQIGLKRAVSESRNNSNEINRKVDVQRRTYNSRIEAIRNSNPSNERLVLSLNGAIFKRYPFD